MSDAVRYEIRDRTAVVTLDRAAAMNAIDESLLTGLRDAIARARTDEQCKAVVITGAGDAFCVGLDIDLLTRAFADLAYFRDVLERFTAVLLALEALPMPVIASVNGLARAGGFELLLACDMVLVADEARIGDTHLAYGIVPGGGATQRLPRAIGRQRARELIFTGRWLDGREAASIGLALASVPRAELDAATAELVGRFTSLSRACLAATKAAMNEGEDLPLERALEVERAHFMRYLEEVPSAREGFQAFVDHRKPVWP